MLCYRQIGPFKKKYKMNEKQILTLFVCLILISVYGIVDAGEKIPVYLDVPLPDDIVIVACTKDVPEEITTFSGVWEGKSIGKKIICKMRQIKNSYSSNIHLFDHYYR